MAPTSDAAIGGVTQGFAFTDTPGSAYAACMAHDPEKYETLAAALGMMEGLSEKKMFGGVCFLLHGNMVAGVFRDRGMVRVGKEREAVALEIDGVDAFTPTGRKMGGIVGLTPDIFDDDASLQAALDLAISFVGSLPPK
ncbi:MAG: TfoX/Sxy family protein [Pikeienuella sp.]